MQYAILSTLRSALFIVALLILASCSRNSLTITGEHGQGDGMVYISVAGTSEAIDSTEMQDGAFCLKTNQLTDGELYILVLPNRMKEFIVEPSGELYLDIEKDYITGTPHTQSVNELLMRLDRAESEDDFLRILENGMKTHDNNPGGAALLYYYSMIAPFDRLMEAYEKSDAPIRNTTLIRECAKTWEIMSSTAAGQPYRDFEVIFEGDTTRLSDFVGGEAKLTLVDFWASWCGPCKREIPELISVYNEFKDKGLQVVGVATWDKPEDTRRAIEALQIPYPQMLNAQHIGSDAYGIEGIPEILLIDANGTILARGLRGPAIREAVAEHL